MENGQSGRFEIQNVLILSNSIIILKNKIMKINNLKANIAYLLRYNVRQEQKKMRQNFDYQIDLINNRLLYFDIITNNKDGFQKKYVNEISNLKEFGELVVYPYKKIKRIDEIKSGFDENKKLPFVIHKDKKLFFPKTWTILNASEAYLNYVECENILGGGYMEYSPHQYQDPAFFVNYGDVLFDIGAAEALFSLEVIDRTSKILIFEGNKEWIEPLKATFEPYNDKVTIINKYVSDKDSATETKLINYLNTNNSTRIFVKIDIEGDEKMLLESNQDFFTKNIEINVACCCYHMQTDAEDLDLILRNYKYKTSFSEGFMIFIYDRELRFPYFRKGIIRAKKVKD